MSTQFERRKGYFKGKYAAKWQAVAGFLLAVLAVIYVSGGQI